MGFDQEATVATAEETARDQGAGICEGVPGVSLPVEVPAATGTGESVVELIELYRRWCQLIDEPLYRSEGDFGV